MKFAYWLALSHLLHGIVNGFIVPQHVSYPGTAWSSKSSCTPKLSPLFAEESDLEPKVPVPPPSLPDLEDALDDEIEEIQVVTQAKAQLSAEEQKNVGASGVGAAFLGLLTGALLILEFPDLDIVMEPLVWPLFTSVVFAVLGFVGGSTDGKVGDLVRGSLGKTTLAIGSAIGAVIKSLINAAIEAAQNKVKKTTEDIKAIPSKVATAAREKVEDTVEEIQRIPSLVKDAAIETAEDVKQKSIKKAVEVVEEIKATPARVVESSKRAAQDAMDDTLDAVEKVVEEVTSIPKKAVENMEEQVSKLVGPKKPVAPQPPDSTPPMADVESASSKTPLLLSEIPMVSTPKLELPKLELPKVEVPKIEVPKLEVPTLALPVIEPQLPKAAPVKETRPRESPVDEIFQIQQAVFKATQEARKEKGLESSKETDQRQRQTDDSKEEARKTAAARKEAAKKAAEAKRQAEVELAQKKAAAEEVKRQREEAIARKKAEASKQKQVVAAQKSLQSGAPRRTISLADLFGSANSEAEEDKLVEQVPLKAQAPPGVPTLRNWKQNGDGSITGIITGSSAFKDGESITTSPVPDGAVSGSVVKTSSGSRYFLGQQGGFSFGFLATPKISAPKPSIQQATGTRSLAPNVDNSAAARRAAEARKAEQAAAAEEKRRIAEAQKAALAEERRKAAEVKAAAQAAAVEERRRAAEEMKAKQAAEQKRKASEVKAIQDALAEERRKAAKEKAAQAAAQAEERRRIAEQKKAAQDAEQKRKTATSQKPVEPSGATKATKPPRGVPEIRAWKKTRDGGVSGKIYGSRSFDDGDLVETSTITKGSLENGSVVSTSSGSVYFLSSEPAAKKANVAAAIKDMSSAKPGATITLTRQRKEVEAAKAREAVKSAKPRATFSLFGLGLGAAEADLPVETAAPRPSRPIPKKEAPRGVPTMSRWKTNSDGSVTGFISGSKAFSDGERVTTSPIKKGKLERGEVVTTGSGSKYFLS